MATLTLGFLGSSVIVEGSIAIWVGARCAIYAAFNLQVTDSVTPGTQARRRDPPDPTIILAMRFR
ncbi:hypothetical protein QTI24_05000 [Variovorax sp. J22P240]|uniref:hypothetical protein n=1 Tax=Variovorax sp. J22P240 TaxID=3053514 RepID=UPI002576C748|nr:hypothetical protein [Variovorax sp. J22P240]MDL9997950.1 hypothetical protein [Variovorax sp. J22P240]